VQPLPREALSEFEESFEMIEQAAGFIPNSMLTMGRVPAILRAFSGLTGAVLMEGKIPRELKQLVAFVSSQSAGCRYCQAHTSFAAHEIGISDQKIASAFEFETSDLFDEAERAALRVARDAAMVPNETTDAQFEALHEHFDDEQIVELVAVISMFGWLNRWNDTMATELEANPLRFAETTLAEKGWEVGRNRG
jgi:uncharacterized peroxidase-related enzyme